MSALLRSARTLALALAVTATGAAAVHHTADACGGYYVSEEDRVTTAVRAFLGELGQRVGYGKVRISENQRAEIVVELDTRAAGGARRKVHQTFLLEKRDGAWKVVDWTFPTAARIAARR